MGCTICHGGQGRATTAPAAHGAVAHWDEPLIPHRYIEAGCGVCHSGVWTPNSALIDRGRGLFEESGCGACHPLDGRADGTGPDIDLSHVSLSGFDPLWADRHAETAATSEDARWLTSALPTTATQREALDAYLKSLIGAPRLMAGKLLAHGLGCLGCHRINGFGGDDGPDLSNIGGRAATDLDFSGVGGEHSLVGWLSALLKDPAHVQANSRMPNLNLGDKQIDLLITYLLSLRTRELPASYWPHDRSRVAGLGAREFSVEGEPLFDTFCRGCHGARGEGRVLGTSHGLIVPAIGGATFLAFADDTFLRRTVTEGRPQHRMPAWGTFEGGLTKNEIRSIIGYLRSLEPQPPSMSQVMESEVDSTLGRRVYGDSCAPCHGERGEGTMIGPPLAARDNPVSGREEDVYSTLVHGIEGTAMGSFRSLDARTMRAVIGAIGELAPVDVSRADWSATAGDPERGRQLFARACKRCHAAQATDPRGRAMAIESPRFTAAASEGFLSACIVRRHDSVRPTLHPSAAQVADLVAYLHGHAADATSTASQTL